MAEEQQGEGGFDLRNVLVQIITQVDELRILFNRFGSGHDQMTDLVVARLLKNEEFFQRVAERVMVIAQNAAPTMRDAVEHAEAEQSSISAGIEPFEGAQGYVAIELNQSGERVVGGQVIFDDADPIPLNIEIPTHVAILSGVNSCYMYHTKAEVPKDIRPGDPIYFRVNNINEAEIQRAQRLMTEERRRDAEIAAANAEAAANIDTVVTGILEA